MFNIMPNLKKLEESIATEFVLLQNTAPFLVSLLKKKISELNYLFAQLENNFSDELLERARKVELEIKGLNKKIEWEQKQCSVFDGKVKKLQELQEHTFTKKLSRKILKNKKQNTA